MLGLRTRKRRATWSLLPEVNAWLGTSYGPLAQVVGSPEATVVATTHRAFAAGRAWRGGSVPPVTSCYFQRTVALIAAIYRAALDPAYIHLDSSLSRGRQFAKRQGPDLASVREELETIFRTNLHPATELRLCISDALFRTIRLKTNQSIDTVSFPDDALVTAVSPGLFLIFLARLRDTLNGPTETIEGLALSIQGSAFDITSLLDNLWA